MLNVTSGQAAHAHWDLRGLTLGLGQDPDVDRSLREIAARLYQVWRKALPEIMLVEIDHWSAARDVEEGFACTRSRAAAGRCLS